MGCVHCSEKLSTGGIGEIRNADERTQRVRRNSSPSVISLLFQKHAAAADDGVSWSERMLL